MPPAQLVKNLIAEVKRTAADDPAFLVGYLSGMLESAIEQSPQIKEWVTSYVAHLEKQPNAKI